MRARPLGLGVRSLAVAALLGSVLGLLVMRRTPPETTVATPHAAVETPTTAPPDVALLDDPDAWLAPIMERNVFDPDVAADPDTEWSGGEWIEGDEEADELAVAWMLLGTMVAHPAEFSSALLVSDDDEHKKAVGVGDLLEDDVIIAEIATDHVIVRNSDGLTGYIPLAEWAELIDRTGSPEPKIAKAGKGAWEVNDGALRPLYTDPRAAMRGVRTRRNANPMSTGVRLVRLTRGNLLYKMGLRRDDTIREVNGQPVKNRKELYEALKGLDKPSSFSIDVTRKRKPTSLSYSVK